jgi:hypothetical protein
MTETFIEKAKAVHGDKYDYSKVEYINSLKEVIIICREHGEFEQLPKTHKRGNGCIKCGKDRSSHARKNTLEEFIQKATQVHVDKYDYSKVEYKKSCQKVIIHCKEHGEYLQTPNGHIGGAGCVKCARQKNADDKRFTRIEFIEKAIEVHRDKYDYSKVQYKNMTTKVIIICREHGEFFQTPAGHLVGKNCVKCGVTSSALSKIKTTEQILSEFKIIHGDKYDYSKVQYKNGKEIIIIICKEHGEFQQKPCDHLSGKICCPVCLQLMFGKWNSSNTNEFIQKAKSIHGDKYDYSKVEYIKSIDYVKIGCKKHGYFEITPNSHLNSSGCNKCYPNHSKIQIKWLNFIQVYYKINIEHAENNGEFSIPETRFKADGYCKETNTIYEFHGDLWHGNPKKFKPDKVSFFGTTYGELYQKTLAKEERIKELGYHLVVMWEGDWNRINHSISILQRKIRK